MKFKLELPINKPRAEIWKAFDDPEKMKVWQPALIRFEPVSDTTDKENDRQFSLIEKITHPREPELFHGECDNQFAGNSIRNEI